MPGTSVRVFLIASNAAISRVLSCSWNEGAAWNNTKNMEKMRKKEGEGAIEFREN